MAAAAGGGGGAAPAGAAGGNVEYNADAGGGVCAAADLPIYIILGHGNETVTNFNSRPQLPKGCTLVTYTKAGDASYREEVCKTIKIFEDSSKEDLLRSVIKKDNKKELLEQYVQHPVNVYKEGDRIPNLEISPVTYWTFGAMEFTKFQRCGVYTFPLSSNPAFIDPFQDVTVAQTTKLQSDPEVQLDLEHCQNNVAYFPWKISNARRISRYYKGSVYPTEQQLRCLGDAMVGTVKSKFKIHITDLMKKLGPGIYYYVICRACSHYYSSIISQIETFFMYSMRIVKNLPDYFQTKEGQTEIPQVKELEAFMKTQKPLILDEKNIQLALERFLQLYDSLPQIFAERNISPTVQGYIREAIGEDSIDKMRQYLQKLRVVRSRSVEQQRGRGRGRTKRRTTKKQKRTQKLLHRKSAAQRNRR